MSLEPGDMAPDFTLTSDRGETVRLADLRGERVVLYFYPKDDTPGCTRQACAIRDNWGAFAETGARLFGVSADSVAKHEQFRDKYDLPFPLLADPDHEAIEPFGVWVEKTNYGKKYMGIERSTFLIDADGRVERVWRRVNPDKHLEIMLEALAT
jgi:thioredoxin-dependent peroxiredoxin